MNSATNPNNKHTTKHAKWIIKLHRHLFRPPHPTLIPCPACGKWFMKANATTVEIENGFGFQQSELVARDAWTQHKHACGAKITVYWSE